MSAPALSAEARRMLLTIARRSLFPPQGGRRDSASWRHEAECVPPELRAPGGAFVSLHTSDGRLRGCVGFTTPRFPLAETVARAAHAAAHEDTRFAPVTEDECADLQIEISVLGPLETVRPEDVVVGRHGLVVRRSGQTGLLLPQVPVAQGWDRATFLAQTCRKAGLSKDAWQGDDCRLEVFEALVFGEEPDAR